MVVSYRHGRYTTILVAVYLIANVLTTPTFDDPYDYPVDGPYGHLEGATCLLVGTRSDNAFYRADPGCTVWSTNNTITEWPYKSDPPVPVHGSSCEYSHNCGDDWLPPCTHSFCIAGLDDECKSTNGPCITPESSCKVWTCSEEVVRDYDQGKLKLKEQYLTKSPTGEETSAEDDSADNPQSDDVSATGPPGDDNPPEGNPAEDGPKEGGPGENPPAPDTEMDGPSVKRELPEDPSLVESVVCLLGGTNSTPTNNPDAELGRTVWSLDPDVTRWPFQEERPAKEATQCNFDYGDGFYCLGRGHPGCPYEDLFCNKCGIQTCDPNIYAMWRNGELQYKSGIPPAGNWTWPDFWNYSRALQSPTAGTRLEPQVSN